MGGVATCVDQQMEQWIAWKAGGGGYLEVHVRESVAIIRGLESPGCKDRRGAADILLQLDSTPILFSAKSYVECLPMPKELTLPETRAFAHRQLHRWMELNRLQSHLYYVDSDDFDDVTHSLVRFASQRATEDHDKAVGIWGKRSNATDDDASKKEYVADMCVLKRLHISLTIPESTGLWPDAWKTMTELTSALESFVKSLPGKAERDAFDTTWRESWPDLKSEIESPAICPSGKSFLTVAASSGVTAYGSCVLTLHLVASYLCCTTGSHSRLPLLSLLTATDSEI